MFTSIQKSGRIAAVAIGLLAALSPLATPPAALAGGSVPTPELEKSYSFKTSNENSFISMGYHTKFAYLRDYDDDYNLKSITLINFNDGSSSPIAIPEKALTPLTARAAVSSTGWTATIWSYSLQTARPKQYIPSLRPNIPTS